MTKKLWGSAALVITGSLLYAAEVEAQQGPLSFYPVPPCRIVDTRGPVGPVGGPKMNANSQRSFPILGSCTLPTTAVAVCFNVTMVAPTDFGNLRLFPAGTPVPTASVVNWISGQGPVANGAITPVANPPVSGNHVTAQVDMQPGSVGQVHLILDVNCYFQ
jgi:hypothetical protein